MTPAADLTGTWNGSFQIDIDDGVDKICSFSGTINLKLQQSGTSLSGNYDYSVTNTQNYHPEWGIDCSLAFSGSTQGSVDGSRITLFFDSWALSGSFTTNLIKLSMSEFGVKASVSLSSVGPSKPVTESETEEPEHEQTVEAYYDEYKEKSIQYLKEGNFKSALNYFEKLIGLAPKDYFGWYGKGIALSALGQYSQAIDNLNKSLERNPTKSDVWKAAGDAYYKLNDCDNAYKYYSNAVYYDPSNSGLKTYQSVAEKCAQQQENEPPLVESESVDTDGDGILDDVDECPKSKETKNLFEDKDGCPDVPPIRSYNIKPGERYINPEQVKVTALGWVIAKGSDIMTATIEYISPDNVKMKCPNGCTAEQMDRLNRIALKNFGGGFEPSMENILDSTKLASVKAAKGKITTIGAHSKFLIKTLPEHMSETETQTWHVLLTGHLAVLDTNTEFFIETDEKGTFVYVLEDYVNVFYQDPTKPILISANEYAFASEDRFDKGTFMPNSVDRWWEQPSKEIENIFAEGSEKKQKVPDWVKNNAKWWAEGQIGETDFVGGIQHLIKEKIIDIPDLPEQASETAKEQVPDWVRNNAGWWADGQISEDDFVNGIKWLVEKGIIKV